jgi:hypothetical protein
MGHVTGGSATTNTLISASLPNPISFDDDFKKVKNTNYMKAWASFQLFNWGGISA